MKKLIILFILSISITNLWADEIVLKKAVVRDDNFNAVIKEVPLENLTSTDRYEGTYFKIVNGKSNEAIRFDDPENIQLKAATTYYHLNLARKFYVEKVGSSYVRDLPQIIIRIDITNVFNEIGHFANDNLTPQYNNALSIPSGLGYSPANISPWDLEIWFRPSKEINVKDISFADELGPSLKNSLHGFRNQTHMTNFKNFFVALIAYAISPSSTNIIDNMMRFAESSVLIEIIYQTSDIAAEFFQRKIYRLDSALIPEIIYHEFSHIALSDRLELTHSTPVNEGLADYFAGKIANSKKLATHINQYNLFNGKEVKNKQLYNLAFERGDYANTDFVFGLLWNVGQTVGEDIEVKYMYEVANRVTTDANIRDDLVKATLDTCSKQCHSTFNDRIKLYKLYNIKGI